MKAPYLEVTYRRGRAMAAYLYLPRATKDKSHRTAMADPGMIKENWGIFAIGVPKLWLGNPCFSYSSLT